MKTPLKLAAIALVITPAAAFAQSETTGVSTPPPAIIDTTPDPAPQVFRPKPSAAAGYVASSAPSSTLSPAATTYGPYVPYNPSGSATPAMPRDPDAEIVTSVPEPGLDRRSDSREDAGIVTHIPSRHNEVPVGTLLRTRIRETLTTASTRVGTPFTAEVTAPMERDGRVIVPVGSTIEGRVTVVRGGKRLSGAAAIHLYPESVTLPDGTHYILHAQVIDTSQHNVTRVNEEGTILRRDHIKGTLAAMSLTTGGAAAAGAMVGGVPGALIGGGIGAGVSTVWWLKQDRQEVIPQNTEIVFSLNVPMVLQPMTIGTR